MALKQRRTVDTSPRPYRIEVPDDVLEDLRDRLSRTRWPEQMPGASWDFGANLDYVRSLCDYWREEYDWRAEERKLNEYPQFLCEVDGVDIHYWHVKGRGPTPFPLMLIHGWPGSMLEFYDVIGPLSDPAAHGGDPADAFDLVIPALPGFGFSGQPKERGWSTRRIAAAFDELMTKRLGYERYGAQGGDWGAGTCARLAANHADNVAAVHITAANAPEPASLTDEDRAYLERFGAFRDAEGAYYHAQGTKPDSLTLAQTDSPAGLAAWIVEKFHTWSDCDGDVESVFTKDQLITNLMFYWAPNSVASSARLYWEMFQEDDEDHWMVKTSAPVAFAVFPEEAWMPPRRWLEAMHEIVQWTEMPAGGHFDAFEQPELMTEDLRKLFRAYR
jgi:microsomal epoxide hydrolase